MLRISPQKQQGYCWPSWKFQAIKAHGGGILEIAHLEGDRFSNPTYRNLHAKYVLPSLPAWRKFQKILAKGWRTSWRPNEALAISMLGNKWRKGSEILKFEPERPIMEEHLKESLRLQKQLSCKVDSWAVLVAPRKKQMRRGGLPHRSALDELSSSPPKKMNS